MSAGLLIVGAKLAAQSVASEAGLLGKEYTGVDFAYIDHTGSKLNRARGASAEFNVPVTRKYDFNFAYDYSYASGSNTSVSSNAVMATLLTYNRTEYGKAYFSGALGYAWDHVKMPVTSVRENGALWAVRTGYEVPMGDRTAINAGLGYSDVFNGRTARNETLEFRLEANHWFSPHVAGVISGAYQHIKHTPDAALYTVGLRWMY